MRQLKLSFLRFRYNRKLSQMRSYKDSDPHRYASLQLQAMRYLLRINALRGRA